MEIVKTGFMYELEDGKPLFSHTSILYSYEENLYVAHVSRRVYEYEHEDLAFENLNGILIRSHYVYPPFDEKKFTKVINPPGDDVFQKEPCLLSYGCEPDVDDASLWKEMYEEACVCETLRKRPHQNLARYLGCRVRNGYMVSLCFEKYVETLRARVRRIRENFNIAECLTAINNAVDHLHSLGFCHNDISPYNIMFKSDGTPVLIDFDSCRPMNSPLGRKQGTPKFSPEGASVSTTENDQFGLQRLEEFLKDECQTSS